MRSDRVKFCPKCEREYAPSHEECPSDGATLMEYEVVEEVEADPLVGVTLDGRFRIAAPLSEGGMGTVYRGVQSGVDRHVAVKVMRASSSSDGTKIRRFLREAQTISQLSHPNIVNFIDFGQAVDHGVLYLVMELIDGCDLSELVGGGKLHPSLVTEIGIQVCSALTEPHHEGVVHRDLKPANLMLLTRYDGSVQIKLVDFGIANAVTGQTRLTQTGVACGTPYYMAPEQVEGDDVTTATDVYALGAIMFHLLTGRVLFDGETDVQILFKHLKQSPPVRDALAGSDRVPGAMTELIDQMLSKSIDQRPESVLAVRDRLEVIRKDVGLDDIRIDPEQSPRRAVDQWVSAGAMASPSPVGGAPETGDPGDRHETGGGADGGRPEAPRRTGGDDTARVPERASGGSVGGEGAARRAASGGGATNAEQSARPDGSEQPALADVLDEADSDAQEIDLETWINIGLSALLASVVVGALLLWQWNSGETSRTGTAETAGVTTARGDEPDRRAAAGEAASPSGSGDEAVNVGDASARAGGDAGRGTATGPEDDPPSRETSPSGSPSGSPQDEGGRPAGSDDPSASGGVAGEQSGSGAGGQSGSETGGQSGDSVRDDNEQTAPAETAGPSGSEDDTSADESDDGSETGFRPVGTPSDESGGSDEDSQPTGSSDDDGSGFEPVEP